jgi:hypothetical protein
VWHLSDLLAWLDARGGHDIKPDVLELARSTKQANLTKEARGLVPSVNEQLEERVA